MVISAFYGKSTFSDGHDGIAEYLRVKRRIPLDMKDELLISQVWSRGFKGRARHIKNRGIPPR
jgi:hypothetical protein